MKILILHDTTATNDNGVDWTSLITEGLNGEFSVEKISLDSREIRPCMGCFNCWVKTPGTCIIKKDEGNSISSSYINSDKVIILSKVTFGGYSSDIKAFMDRGIVNISPFFEIKNGEMHHKKWYSKYPDLIFIGYGDFTEEEKDTFIELSNRNALNFCPSKYVTFTIRDSTNIREIVEELKDFLHKGWF